MPILCNLEGVDESVKIFRIEDTVPEPPSAQTSVVEESLRGPLPDHVPVDSVNSSIPG